MTDLRNLIVDLRAHAHEAPAQCAALMRRAATELQLREASVTIEVVPGELPTGYVLKEETHAQG